VYWAKVQHQNRIRCAQCPSWR